MPGWGNNKAAGLGVVESIFILQHISSRVYFSGTLEIVSCLFAISVLPSARRCVWFAATKKAFAVNKKLQIIFKLTPYSQFGPSINCRTFFIWGNRLLQKAAESL